MGFFSRSSKPKPNPKITVEGIEIEFHHDYEWWGFTYRGTEFSSFETSLSLPSKAQLDAILNTIESLKPEMRARLMKGLRDWGDSKVDSGETYSVDVKDFIQDGSFSVSWSGGESWADMGIEFTIKDGTIVDEFWGD